MKTSKHPIVQSQASIRDALEVIDSFAKRICYVLEDSKLVGVLTDGDVRRSLLNEASLDDCVDAVMNRDFVSFPIHTDSHIIRDRFSTRIRHIPLVNEKGELVDVADPQGNFRIPILEPSLMGNELKYVTECIETNWISSQGKFVRSFETFFEKLHPNMHALAVSNGTVALHLALVAVGIKEGDEVIVPNVTFAASANAVIYCGAVPVLCEIDPNTWCIDPLEVEKLIGPKTKAIMPVHLYGQSCDMAALKTLADDHDLLLIEDCAEALGSKWKEKPVGTFGNASTFSFFGNKTITTGEGGMVLFSDSSVKEQAKVLRDHGMNPKRKYWHDQLGYNYRLTNLQAAVGVAQIERLDQIISKKIEIAKAYGETLSKVEGIIKLPCVQKFGLHSNWLYTVVCDKRLDRGEIIKKLKEKGVETRPAFYPLSDMPAYENFPKSNSVQNSKSISYAGISLPSSPNLSLEKIHHISEIIHNIFQDLDSNQ